MSDPADNTKAGTVYLPTNYLLAKNYSSDRIPKIAFCLFLFCGGCVALLWPALTDSPESARRMQCINNMKQLGIAMHMFHDSNERFPGYDDPENPDHPLCSWRVQLLPFYESNDVHERYDRTQSWNSTTNIALEKDIWHYCKCPSNPDSTDNSNTETDYVTIVGPHCFSHEKGCTTLDDISDGVSNTIMLVESSDTGIHWMEPRDLKFEDARIVEDDSTDIGIRSYHSGIVNVTFCDGIVKSISKDIDPKLLKALMTIDGGESVESFFQQDND
ncbi:MAG: DUF1559 domain-containing protein [Planctomycetota bacterium]|nr:DUF1559 domain-containing protein [Planctomycetota bacterium]